MNDKKPLVSTKPLSGFMELLPAEQILFNQMLDTIRQTYEVFGFVPIDNPILERSEVLLAKAGGETEKQIYRFSRGKKDLSMRFDLTVPLARYVANNYYDLTFPFKRYAIGKVYRGERSQAGRFREFYQCDIDVIGNSQLALNYDAELVSVIDTIFNKLGFKQFTIRINNRKIFNGLFMELGLVEKSNKIMQTIDRLEKIGPDKVKKELENYDLTGRQIETLFNFINLKGDNDELLLGLEKIKIDNQVFRQGVKELKEVIKIIRQLGVAENNFKVDLTIARGLDYYTGTVYETKLDQYPEIGSVCSGGRYDDLASHYTKQQLPGVGISIGLTRLFDQLIKKNVLKPGPSTLTQVLIIPLTEENLDSGLKLASKLRKNKIATELLFDNNSKKSLKYANKLGVKYAVFIGETEKKGDFLTVKNLLTKTQNQLSEEELIERIKQHD